jgi:hypothetical protein
MVEMLLVNEKLVKDRKTQVGVIFTHQSSQYNSLRVATKQIEEMVVPHVRKLVLFLQLIFRQLLLALHPCTGEFSRVREFLCQVFPLINCCSAEVLLEQLPSIFLISLEAFKNYRIFFFGEAISRVPARNHDLGINTFT